MELLKLWTWSISHIFDRLPFRIIICTFCRTFCKQVHFEHDLIVYLVSRLSCKLCIIIDSVQMTGKLLVLGRMFLVGLSQGPPHHYWYTFLDKHLPKRDLRTVGIKILADQLIAAPFFALTFFYGIGLLEKNTFSGCWTEFVAKFPYIYAVSTLREKIQSHSGI